MQHARAAHAPHTHTSCNTPQKQSLGCTIAIIFGCIQGFFVLQNYWRPVKTIIEVQ